MKRQLLICLAASSLCGLSTSSGADGFATWNAKSGALSYSIFNLSGNNCTLTAYGATPNTSTTMDSSSMAASAGWNSLFDGNVITPGFFGQFSLNGPGIKPWPYVVFYGDSSPMQEIYNYSGSGTGVSMGAALNYPYSPTSIGVGKGISFVEPTIQIGSQPNPAAAGDSWEINCIGGDPIVMANLASAGDSLGSGLLWHAQDYFVSNALINPPAPPTNVGPYYNPPSPSGNVNGQGFVSSEDMVFNLNQNPADANYVGTGGLWLGIENPNTQGANTQAVYSLVPSMFPVNLSSYTQPQQENNNGNTQWQSYIYGAHLTFAIGDPFIISSFAAKTLWYLATSQSNLLGDSTLTNGDNISTINPPNLPTAGVFPSSSNAQNYIDSLMYSTAQAGYVVNEAITAASQANDHESFWGKVFSALFNVTMTAIDVGAAVATGGASDAAQVGIQTAVNTTTGGLQTAGDNAINSAYTTNTTMGAPTTQTAPLAYNSTFASSNLLGLMLTNFYVQYQVNSFTSNTGNPNPLWSNALIYTTEAGTPGACSDIQVSANLFSPNTECTYLTSSGSVSSATQAGGQYSNVCLKYGSGGDDYCSNRGLTGNQLNIWDAVMTGSTVGTDSNGQLAIQNPSTWTFQPPTLINNDTNIAQISTTFNLNTGALTLVNYVNASAPPTTQPEIINATASYGSPTCGTLTYEPLNVQYDSTTGMLSSKGWQSGCEGDLDVNQGSNADPNYNASLNVATCQAGSNVNFVISGGEQNGIEDDWRDGPNSVSLVCASQNTTTAEVVLDYNNCVQDQSATGGVVVGLNDNGNEVALACACIPSYVSGEESEPEYGCYATSSGTTGTPCVGTGSCSNNTTASSTAVD
ncbi:hypothetical protein [Thiocapsa rosea]|uniref:Uncharacterized protein n=1 Tax=Thiocapsa rosea TaxID=69360 RepID=A0A495V6P6_9GAMM|nr:hypothetical protein [Thiocapsa rosea]RKT44017.1 hypothetical protein BDD21_1388 [Thiocapsa rosea]